MKPHPTLDLPRVKVGAAAHKKEGRGEARHDADANVGIIARTAEQVPRRGHLALWKAADDGFRGSEALQAKQRKKNKKGDSVEKRNP